MKASTLDVRELLQRSHEIRATPRLIAEWEHNRFSKITTLIDGTTGAIDPEWTDLFPLDSIIDPNRPRTGIAKAILDPKLKVVSSFRNTPNQSRFYPPTGEDTYKYYVTQERSTLIANEGGAYSLPAPRTITLIHEEQVIANKIVLGFETSYSKPSVYTVQVSDNGTTWRTIANSPTINSAGQVTLYRQDANTWTDVPNYTKPQLIQGLRITVQSINAPYSRLSVLQMGFRLETDLSETLINYSKTFEMSDRSFIAPLGKASSNTANVELSNFDNRFNDSNESSAYFGLIGKKVKMTLDLVVNVNKTGVADQSIREFTMWTDSWGGQSQGSVQVALKDSSIFLQEEKVPEVFWQNMSIGAIVWQLMDRVGMSNYNYNYSVADSGQIVPFFWPTQDANVWEQIAEISEATQTAVYFDEYDVMQIKTRSSLFSKSLDWNFDAVNNGLKLPDIASLSAGEDLVTNSVEVTYKPAKFDEFNGGLPKMTPVWEPEGETLALIASSLTSNVSTTSTSFQATASRAVLWPYGGLVNINSEIIQYNGKEYMYYLSGGGSVRTVVYSQDEKEALDATSDPNLKWANAFTGKMMIVNRGVGLTPIGNHLIKPTGYSGYVNSYDGTRRAFPTGMTVNDGVANIKSEPSLGVHSYQVSRPSAAVTPTGTYYGTRMRIPSAQVYANAWAVGGIFFAGTENGNGYYLEVSTTNHVDGIEQRQFRHEISLVSMRAGGYKQIIGGIGHADSKGWVAAIAPDVWYDIDLKNDVLPDGRGYVSVFLNGVFAGDWFIPPAERVTGDGTKFGLHVRHQCHVDYEYLYAVNKEDIPTPDESSFLDLVSGGYQSATIKRDWMFGNVTGQTIKNNGVGVSTLSIGGQIGAINGSIFFLKKNNYTVQQTVNNHSFFFEEFAPVVHEIREFDVAFSEDQAPVETSYAMVSNTRQATCVDYLPSPFGAKFWLANTSRDIAVLKGQDTITRGIDEPLDQTMFIYGRVINQEDEKKLVREDTDSIRKMGITSLVFNNRFVQTEAAANDLAQFVVKMWSNGADEITIDVFGNFLVQLGDQATINFPMKGMLPGTHKYYVVSINNTFAQGLKTTLVLRRIRL